MRPTMKVTNGRFLRIIASRLVSMPRPLDGGDTGAGNKKRTHPGPGYCQQAGHNAQPCSRPCTLFALSSFGESCCIYPNNAAAALSLHLWPDKCRPIGSSYPSEGPSQAFRVNNVHSKVYGTDNASSLQDIRYCKL